MLLGLGLGWRWGCDRARRRKPHDWSRFLSSAFTTHIISPSSIHSSLILTIIQCNLDIASILQIQHPTPTIDPFYLMRLKVSNTNTSNSSPQESQHVYMYIHMHIHTMGMWMACACEDELRLHYALLLMILLCSTFNRQFYIRYNRTYL